MTKPEVLEKVSMNLSQLKQDLENIKKRDGELSFRGNKTEEYVNEFAILKAKDAEALFKEIEAINIPRLKENHINKLIDTMPGSVNEMKVIMQSYGIPITNDNLKKIADAIAKHAPKKKK